MNTISENRKATPVYSGVVRYFPRALQAVAQLSKAGNDKHNPGEPLRWSRDKSNDHLDCIMRHLIDAGTVDPEDGFLHDVKIAWRALANLELALERLERPTMTFLGAPYVVDPDVHDATVYAPVSAEPDAIALALDAAAGGTPTDDDIPF